MSVTAAGMHTIQKGDTLWKVAQKNLGTTGISNSEIMAEMKRLAQANGYGNDYEKLANQFKIGNTIKLGSAAPTSAKEVEVADTTKRKKTPDPKQTLITEINKLPTSKDRIIEYNKTFGKKHYAIVDKKACTITLYDKDGNIVKDQNGNEIILPVGVGKYKGDNLMYGYASDDKKMKEAGRYTAAGEFTLDELDGRVRSEDSFANYGERVMDLKGDNHGVQSAQMALHQVPETISKNERTNALRNDKNPDGTLKTNRNTRDNRMSYGCVNLLPEDYDTLYAYLKEGNKVYVLPEERGNKLTLEIQPNGREKFVQDYHKDQERGLSAEEASKVYYDKETSAAPGLTAKLEGLAYKTYNWVSNLFA